MKEFSKKNPNLGRTMNTHLIRLDTFGIWEDDYEKFISRRCRAIAKELSKRVIYQAIDEQGQEVHTDDYEEAEYEESTG
jgi:hypothetical protein